MQLGLVQVAVETRQFAFAAWRMAYWLVYARQVMEWGREGVAQVEGARLRNLEIWGSSAPLGRPSSRVWSFTLSLTH